MNFATVAARSLFRNRFRTALTVLGAAAAIVAFILIRTVLNAYNIGADYAAKDRIATRHKLSWVILLPKRYVDTIRQVPGVQAATFANWFGGKDPRNPNEFFATLAVEDTYLDVFDEMVVPPAERQAWLEDKKGAIVGKVLANKLGLKIGDKITLQGTIFPGDWEFYVRGIYSASRKSVDQSQFLFHWGYMNDALPERRKDKIGWVASRIDNPAKSAEISTAIDKIFDEKDVPTVSMSERAMNVSFMGMFSAILTALNYVSIVILVIMTLILGNTIAMAVRERTNEYGVLRAIGFSPSHVRWFVLGEATTLGIVAGLVGVGIAYPLVDRMLGRWIEENFGSWFPYFRVGVQEMVLGVLIAIVLSVVAAMIPAHRASKIEVTQALRRIA